MLSQTNRGLQSVQDRTVVITGGEFGYRPRDSCSGESTYAMRRAVVGGGIRSFGIIIDVEGYQ
jgi:hypothetical protein